MFCFFAASAVSALTTGMIVRRFSTSPVVRLSALVGGVSMLVIALLAQHTPVLVGAPVLAGWGNGIGQPASNDLIARAVATHRHGLAYGTKQAAIPLATMVAGVAVPVIAIPWGWRPAFAVGAGLALLMVLTVHGGGRMRPPGSSEPSDAAGPFRRAPLFVLAAGLMLGAATGNALGSFFVATAVDGGIAPATAGVLAAIASGTGAAARVVMGWLADRVRAKWLLVLAAQMAIGGLSYGLLGTGVEVLIAAGAVIGYCTGLGLGRPVDLLRGPHAARHGRRRPSRRAGWAPAPPRARSCSAWSPSATDYSVAWYGTAGISVVAGAVIVQGRRMLMRERPGLVAAQQQRRTARR